MAIHYPKLFCPKGAILESIKEIDLNDDFIRKGEKLYVHNIVAYGYDLHLLFNKEIFFRVSNSQMKDFFKVIVSPFIDRIENQNFKKASFVKDFQLRGEVLVKSGSEYFYEKESLNGNSFYNIYDDYDKILRFKESEAKEFLNIEDLGQGLN